MPGGTTNGGCGEDTGRTKHWWSDSSDDDKSYDEGGDDGGAEPAYQYMHPPNGGGGGDELLPPSSSLPETTTEHDASTIDHDRHSALTECLKGTGIEGFVDFCERWIHYADAPDQDSETTGDGGTEDFDDETKDTSVGSNRPEMKMVVRFTVLLLTVLFLSTIWKVKYT